MGLRKEITVRVALPLVLGILITVVISAVLVLSAAPKWISTTKDSILQEEQANLGRLASAKASLLDITFNQILNEMSCYAEYVETVLGGYPVDSILPSYAGVSSVSEEVPPGGLIWSDKHNAYISLDASLWYVPGVVDSDMIDETVNDMLNATSVIDLFYAALYAADDQFSLLYFVFSSNSFMKYYPFRKIDSWVTTTYTCPDGSQRVGYDAKCRPYYAPAYNADDDVVIPPAYIGASAGSLVISPGRSIFVNQQKVGVVSASISMNELKLVVENTKVLTNGYAYVIQQDGTVVFHPKQDINKPLQNILTLEFGSSESDKSGFQPILNQMTRGENGNGSFYREGDLWYISFEFIASTQMSLAVVVSDNDVSVPANDVEAQLTKVIAVQLAIFAVIVVVAAVVIGILTAIVSRRIVQPVLALTKLTEKITRGDMDIELEAATQSKGSSELDKIYGTFRSLITAVKFGNSSYFAGDWTAALKNYTSALTLFEEMGNLKGIGLCYNNMGNVYYNQKNLVQSRENFKNAIDIAQRLCEEYMIASLPPNEVFKLKANLATRLNNMALLAMEERNKREAEECFQKGLSIDSDIGHVLQFATHSVNLGELFLDFSDPDNAHKVFQNCYAVVVKGDIPENSAKWLSPQEIDIAKQYAYYGMGLFYRCETTDLFTALRYFAKALECGSVMDRYVHGECLKHMSVLFEQNSMGDIADYIKSFEGANASMEEKDVVFVLDYSGSMAGARIKAAIKNLKTLFSEYIYAQDNVGLYVFSNVAKRIFQLQRKDEKKMIRYFDEQNHPGGGTAFYDALFDGFAELEQIRSDAKKEERHSHQWLIALTDGEDNKSKHSLNDILVRASKATANIIIIGVLLENKEIKGQLQNICKQNEEGVYIDVDTEKGIEGLDEAFQAVSAIITGKMNVETFNM